MPDDLAVLRAERDRCEREGRLEDANAIQRAIHLLLGRPSAEVVSLQAERAKRRGKP